MYILIPAEVMWASRTDCADWRLLDGSSHARSVWRRREKQLRQVKVSAEDVALIAAEFEVDKKRAELRLREHGGDVKAALESFL